MKSMLIGLLMMLTLSAVAQETKEELLATLFNATQQLYKEKRYDEALFVVNRIIKSDAKNADYYDMRARIYYYKNLNDSALINHNMAILLEPDQPTYYANRGLFFYNMQMPDESIDDLTLALKYEKTDSLRHLIICNRGAARNMKRDFQGAYKDFKSVYDEDSTNIQALSNLGMVLDDLGRINDAIMYLEKALHIDPNETAVLCNLGYRYMDLGDYKMAIRQFKRMLEVAPDDPLGYNNMGYAKYKMNDLKGALKDIEHSIQLLPENSYAYRNRALVYLAMKETDKACENLHKAVDLGYTPMYGDDVQQLLEKHCLFKNL
ncbi:Tetratricopeptide repeat-containing protein [Chitinophaga sp. YR627]|uniref:tetratricopeptide repeat protein n=1 Tax=Chitinophaga sp. YR627 TaxID=1881041 RepID=UPI0008EBCFEF|nr:tetratricopeptide repeat protein [Chitinophaga sp. YR627]SFO88132.1 Tetratricopeptide repeat-containing protein [Chitinophaga sp. YR627]